jgi:cytochrome c2
MLRRSALLAALGGALLLVSFIPGPASGADAPANHSAPLARQLERGRVLFRDKGCVTCHAHKQAPPSGGECCQEIAPDLSAYSGDPAFLQRWLADPPAVRPQTMMPGLQLSEAEIVDLIAFLNQRQP